MGRSKREPTRTPEQEREYNMRVFGVPDWRMLITPEVVARIWPVEPEREIAQPTPVKSV